MSEYPPPGQYPPPPGQYPPPPPGDYPPPGNQPGQPYWQESPQRKGLAITALVLGILAVLGLLIFFGAVILGPFAVLFGIIAAVKARRGTAGGFGMAVTGIVLGVLALAGAVAEAIVGYSFFVNHGGRDYMDCIRDAGSDQSKVQQCEDDFRQTLENNLSVTRTPQPTR
ncbi:DUF4190 domain-containing protein [Nocardia blacklockiae]|uniref:DUF4190 domain-containing protein n=1 Tax=Nocardia blacklockiae TaxID=480036 RepID=UPI001895AC42|nr:DUF4190 domain-containing protein [Nocardia blacklockiae]MBF6176099.1 DUF4190 domain-containing protein [Nocardia blacklockiae]